MSEVSEQPNRVEGDAEDKDPAMPAESDQLEPTDSSESEPARADPPRTPVIRVWDRLVDERDPPSQRPEDTYEEARRRRRAS